MQTKLSIKILLILLFQNIYSYNGLAYGKNIGNPQQSKVQEFYIRKGLPNFFSKATSGKPLRVGYIGGSITHVGERYRDQTTTFIKELFPSSKLTELVAAVPGTDADLGACRIEEQLLAHKPDLIFVEFAVNGGFDAGMEGIVRKIWENNPFTDICFIYTVTSAQLKFYQKQEVTPIIKRLEQLAEHYQIPSVHMGLIPAKLVTENKLIPQADQDDGERIAFSKDGVHPLKKGGDLYAQSIANALKAIMNFSTNKDYSHPMPMPITNHWADAKMLDPQSAAAFTGRWTKVSTQSSKSLAPFAEWFPYVMKGEDAGATFTVKFKGNMIGFFDVGAPEVGQLEMEIDGKPAAIKWQRGGRYVTAENGEKLMNRFTKYANNRYRGQYAVIEVKPGEHVVTFRISVEKADKIKILENKLGDITAKPEKYNQSVIYLGKILLRGELLP